MATRESLNKLKKNSLQRLAEELGVVFEKKTKEEIINSILNLNVPIHFEGSPLDTPHFTEVQYVSLDAEAIPDLPFSAIVRFMVDRQVQGRAVQNFRGLDRAAKHFEAGDVKEILMAKVNDSTIYFKAFCLASMKKIKYQIFISARCLEGEMTINHAYCQCPIGLAQSCSHIGSLLFALNSIKKEAENSCTSKLCKWNVPRQLNLPAAPLSEMNLRKAGSIASGGDQPIKKTIQFDPRHPDHRDTDLSALQALRDVFPNTGMACIWDIPERTPTPVSEVTVTSYVNPLETDLQKLVDLSESLHANILQPISEELSSFVEMRTRSQRNSPEWISLHKGRLTSSIFGDIIRAGEHPRSLISGILHGSSLQR
ncbi:uncharacterized protein LOC133178487 [Saccostrea echinata]|uniref:uncharacterized protein LOC133178487 n=1 Tax=Saccostrea echinata TaxID=191078 RepID=UPI002A80F559|nr:uncharacterized protein LOC133178487 [Saccostrea echinata]